MVVVALVSQHFLFCSLAFNSEKHEASLSESARRMADLIKRGNMTVPPEMHLKYIELLCEYEPDRVYTYLSTHAKYPLDGTLALCRHYKVLDATAFLLERTGDVRQALELVLETMHQRLQVLAVRCDQADKVGGWVGVP